MRRLLKKVVESPYLRRDSEVTGIKEIILWWESRRVPYNLAVGIVGLLTSLMCWVSIVLVELSGKFEESLIPDPPFFAVVSVILYAVGANVCYTAGWLVEGLLYWAGRKSDRFFGPITFALGTIFSLLLTLMPAFLMIGAALVILVKP